VSTKKNVVVKITDRQIGKKNSSDRNREIKLKTKVNHTQMRRTITLKITTKHA
jgi:hypothetical protein